MMERCVTAIARVHEARTRAGCVRNHNRRNDNGEQNRRVGASHCEFGRNLFERSNEQALPQSHEVFVFQSFPFSDSIPTSISPQRRL